jgi:predicted outer membrane repeat protein
LLAGGTPLDVGFDGFLSASTLSYNSAYYGGGIFNGGTPTVNAGTTLSDNSGRQGGGIFNTSGTVAGLTIDGRILSGNSAINGGGIFDSAGTLTVSDCTLTGNSATVKGGGIYLGGNSATVTVKDSSTITGNSAPAGSGADVYNYGVVYRDSTSTIGILDGNPARPS